MPNNKSKPETIHALKESLICANQEASDYLERCRIAEQRQAEAENLAADWQAQFNSLTSTMQVLVVLLRREFSADIDGLEK